MVVVSKEAADTVSLRGGMLEVEGESDFTAEPVAPGNKERNSPHQRKLLRGDDSPRLSQRQECESFSNGPLTFRYNLFFFFFNSQHFTALISFVQ